MSTQLIQEEPAQWGDAEKNKLTHVRLNTCFMQQKKIYGLDKIMHVICTGICNQKMCPKSGLLVLLCTIICVSVINTCLSGLVSMIVEGTSSPKQNYSHNVWNPMHSQTNQTERLWGRDSKRWLY